MNEILTKKYCEILISNGIGSQHLGMPIDRPGGSSGLSGLFLPSVSDGYRSAKNKVMIVGCETAGWEPLKIRDIDPSAYEEFQSIESYVDKAMSVHKSYFLKELEKQSNDRGRTFHNFMRAVASAVGGEGLVYSNLFCFDWGRKSPIGCPEFDFVKALSKDILNVQIDILQPQYIVFANGISSAGYRREFFPVGDGGRCTNTKSYPEIISSKYFWEFTLDEKIRCFRTHHPSARSKPSQAGQKLAIDLLTNGCSRNAQ